jgi:NAD(P)-dependent dehydrogenase (short-subunit alcohol dehydrogenase family)
VTEKAHAGKIALVTGASRGIGRGIALRLAAGGAHVVLAARTQGPLLQTTAEVRASGAQATPLSFDLLRREAIQDAAARVQADLGRLDILVNNAGIGRFGKVAEMTPRDWDDLMGTNLHAVFHLCQAFWPLLQRQPGAAIVNISSLAGINPFPGGAAYCASKAALDAFSHALMLEAREQGMRVFNIVPGSVSTEFRGAQGLADWKLKVEDVVDAVDYALSSNSMALPSRIELRPLRPQK